MTITEYLNNRIEEASSRAQSIDEQMKHCDDDMSEDFLELDKQLVCANEQLSELYTLKRMIENGTITF